MADESAKKSKSESGAQGDTLRASRQLARCAAQLAHDRHCRDVVILELADRSPVAQHFLLCTGTSEQQIRSVAQEIARLAKESGFTVFGQAGMQQGRWVVVDCIDVVVHLFDDEFRKFYDLELLWGDAPRIEWERDDADR